MSTELSTLTGKSNFFEDFAVGDVYEHARGKTVEGLENVLITNLVLNTAQAHFNEDLAESLEQKHRITAVLAGNDEIAHGVWEGLLKAGRDVPRDVSLIGFDDQHGMGRLEALTSVRVEATEVGRQLAKMAIEKIKSKGVRVPEVTLATTLVKRETCKPLFQVN